MNTIEIIKMNRIEMIKRNSIEILNSYQTIYRQY